MAKFEKGKSGNPGGRPKGVGDLREVARQHTHDAVQVLVEVMADATAAPSARVGAAQALLDRGWGRAPQSLEISEKREEVDDGLLLKGMVDLLKLASEGKLENRRKTETASNADANGEGEITPTLEVAH